MRFGRLKIFPLFLAILFVAGASGEAQAQYYFGRNKIQYNQFDWHIIKTRHFDIYFYPEMEELARVGAAYAEEAYRTLAARFDQTVQRRIPLIFYSSHFHFEETNVVPYLIPEGVGGFFEYIKGRVVIPANGSLADFHHVIWHELVHVFTHSKVSRVMKDNKKLQGAGLPLWFIEGIAEYWSQGWDTQAEMVLRDAVISGYLVPIEEMYQISGTFLMYKEGQAVCRYIARRYGEVKLLQLFENLWKGERFELVLKETLGKDYRELDSEWLYWLKKQYFPLLEKEDLPHQISPRITREGINTKPAFYREDGKPYVVFYSNRTGYSNIYRMPLTGLREERPRP
ncbi:MAG TPA: hypothetical protein ENJ23_04460, partial [Bacteroidetes bacterium]|nr:hypothetical protein [Bacteroidota bacterium]